MRRPRCPVDRHDARPDDRARCVSGWQGPYTRVLLRFTSKAVVLVHALALLHARLVREAPGRAAQTVELRGTANVDVEAAGSHLTHDSMNLPPSSSRNRPWGQLSHLVTWW